VPGVKKSKKWIGYLLVLVVCLMGVGAYTLYYFSDPEPVSFEQLAPTIDSLKPMVAQLENYRDAHGKYPTSLAAIGLPNTLNVHGLPTEIDYASDFELNEPDLKTKAYVTSTGMSLSLRINKANWLFYQHTPNRHAWCILTGNSMAVYPVDH